MRLLSTLVFASLALVNACVGDTAVVPNDGGADVACVTPKITCTLGAQTSCVDPRSDNQNCGSCNTVCSTGTTCVASQCSCTDTTKVACPATGGGQVCVDVTSDPKNCGACGNKCINTHCTAGECDHVVFVTDGLYFPNLTSGTDPFTPADADCQTSATAAKLTGTYKAWLATQQSSPSTRFAKGKTPYVLSDGTTRVADDWADFTKGSLQHAIDHTESNTAVPSDVTRRVMTNVATDGTSASASSDCTSWTKLDASLPIVGDPLVTTGDWTNMSAPPANWTCQLQFRLYCVGQ